MAKKHLTRYDIDMETRGKLLIDNVAGQISETLQRNPQAMLALSVFALAVTDYTKKKYRANKASAIAYLRGDLIHIQLLDIDPDYIRRLYKRYAMTELLECSTVEALAA